MLVSQNNALSNVRQFLEKCWLWSHQRYIAGGQKFFLNKRTTVPTPLSTDMCRHTTLFMLGLLAAAGDTSWKVAGGRIQVRGKDEFAEHWWLERGDSILDLNADQFGWPTVVLLQFGHGRYKKDPALSKKSAISSLEKTVAQWRGYARSVWSDADPLFKEIAEAYPAMAENFARVWSNPTGPKRQIFVESDPKHGIRWHTGTDGLPPMTGPAVRLGVDFATKRYEGNGTNHDGVTFPLEVHVRREEQVAELLAPYDISVSDLTLVFDQRHAAAA